MCSFFHMRIQVHLFMYTSKLYTHIHTHFLIFYFLLYSSIPGMYIYPEVNECLYIYEITFKKLRLFIYSFIYVRVCVCVRVRACARERERGGARERARARAYIFDKMCE